MVSLRHKIQRRCNLRTTNGRRINILTFYIDVMIKTEFAKSPNLHQECHITVIDATFIGARFKNYIIDMLASCSELWHIVKIHEA